jgi:carboxymethylenebutenolidase
MGETIKLTADDGFTFHAYQAKPEGKPKGCIVVIQEIFGVNGHIRRDADKFAKLGYMAVAPAVFDRVEKGVALGYDQPGMEKGRELVTKLGLDNALRDIRATANYLLTFGPVGAVGYCWGGSVAWACATRLGIPAVGYYGGRTIQLMHEKPQAPCMLHFGARDQHIPLGDVTKLRYAHQSVPMHVYEAGHGFNCDDRAGSYDKAAADLALQRTLDFFKAHLV